MDKLLICQQAYTGIQPVGKRVCDDSRSGYGEEGQNSKGYAAGKKDSKHDFYTQTEILEISRKQCEQNQYAKKHNNECQGLRTHFDSLLWNRINTSEPPSTRSNS